MNSNVIDIKPNSILVVGDVMLDIYNEGEIERISPEAPVPVFKLLKERCVPGGAANVAMNLIAAGQRVSVMGVVGKDSYGDKLNRVLVDHHIKTNLFQDDSRTTTVKIRYIANNNQQVMRTDTECIDEIPQEVEYSLLQEFETGVSGYDAVILSDYRKGFLSASLVKEIIKLCNKNGIKVFADIKDNSSGEYNGAFLLKPNKKELGNLVGRKLSTDDNVREAARELVSITGCEYVLATLGAKGMLLVGKDMEHMVPSVARDVYDVTGAGDTAISYLTACVTSGIDLIHAVMIANIASGIQVGKVGTSSVSLKEITEYLKTGNIIEHTDVMAETKVYERCKAKELREKLSGKKVVFTNGCFDILHTGHTRCLNEAKKLGDTLIVGVNSDESVKRIKGKDRPINPLEDRMEVIASLGCVDYVIPFEEDTPYELISEISPSIIVKGGDYKIEDVVGRDIVEANGGQVVIIPLVEGKSTTEVIDRMRQ